MSMKMLELDYTNVDITSVGNEHGLELRKTFALFKGKMADWVSNIWFSSRKDGEWLAWLNLADREPLVNDIINYAESVKGKFDNIVVLGIGGSALGGIAVTEALLKPYWNTLSKEQRNGRPRIFFLDNIDPDQVFGLLSAIDLKNTLVNVISKSGTTAETMSQYMIFDQIMRELLGESYKEHIVITTDQHKGVLRRIAQEEDIKAFPVPDDVGGRFSVFSPVGMLPLALVGIDIKKIIQGIKDITANFRDGDVHKNIAAQYALINVLLDQKKGKHISVCMPYSSRLRYVSDWYVQLWAESLGKEEDLKGNKIHSGQTPLKAVGPTDQHSQVQLYNEGPNDKVITFIRVEKFDHELKIPKSHSDAPELDYMAGKTMNELLNAEAEATKITLSGYNRPNLTITLPEINEYYIGQLLFFFEVATAIAGKIYNIDAFNQPGVEQAKNYTYALMGRTGYEKLAKTLQDRMSKPPLKIRPMM